MEAAYLLWVFSTGQTQERKIMTADSIILEIKQALAGRPGQPMVLGVCQAFASRYQQQTWGVRLAAIIFGVIWTLPTLAAYILLGFLLSETENRTRGFFSGLGVVIREACEKVFGALGRVFGDDSKNIRPGIRNGTRNGGY
jgi:phage shock protein PspC (stress-responsive transcriptional regulator)